MAADTYTTTLGAILMGTGNDNNTWGNNLNTGAIQILEDAIANTLASAVTGGTLDLSGSPPPAAASQVRHAALIFTGALTSNQTVLVPNLKKYWWVSNQTTGAFTLKIQPSGGSASIAIPQNNSPVSWQLVQCDGAGNIIVSPFNTRQVQMVDGSASVPAYSFINEGSGATAPNTGWYRNGTQDIRLSINGSDVLQVTGAGAGTPSVVNVLSPNALQVAGNQYIPAGSEVAYAGITAPTGWYLEYGQAVSRTTDATLFAAITATATGNTHSNTTLDNLSTDLRGLGLVGANIEGTGIPTGTTISSINSATSLTLSQAASSTNSGLALRILPYGQGDGSTTFNIPDRRGRVLAGRDDMSAGANGAAANRLTLGGSGINGIALDGAGGSETVTLTAAQIPAHTHGYAGTTGTESATHTHIMTVGTAGAGSNYAPGGSSLGQGGASSTESATHTHSYSGTTDNGTGGGGSHQNTQPTGISNFMIKR